MRASWYGGIAESKDCLSDEMLESLLLMYSGILRTMDVGWLLWRLTYCGVLFGLVNGLNVWDRRSNVMSKKSTDFLFASMVIMRLWLLNVLHISFLMFSTSLGVPLNTANPSSRYKPMLLP